MGKLKIQRNFQGTFFWEFPTSTVFRAEKGILCNRCRLSYRKNSYICKGTGKLTIEEGCFINKNVMIVDHDYDYKESDRKNAFITSPILIGDNV
ncbi:hypothetical protein DXC78_05485 [Faecalicoccus pleomorphus]|uniref:Acyltransferase n=1 Tax=Faecalicoccus pleomorphus TaxID=1323 RepID=A0A3E3E6U0_9FIRM|nr:hypothetical protein DXC78_05485 [Faecalicoccus pleomorphus]